MNFWSYKVSVFCLMIGHIKVYKWFYIVIFIKIYQSMSSFPWKLSSTSIISKHSTKCFFLLDHFGSKWRFKIKRNYNSILKCVTKSIRPKWNICVNPVAYQQNLGSVGREIIKFCYNKKYLTKKIVTQSEKVPILGIFFLQRPFECLG